MRDADDSLWRFVAGRAAAEDDPGLRGLLRLAARVALLLVT